MARITTYALDSNISLNDKLVGTDADDNSITKNYSIDALGDGLISLKNIITGGGTLNTIPIFTPDGQIIGDSIITQGALGQGVTIAGQLNVTEDFFVSGSTELLGALTVEGISSFNDELEANNNATFYSSATFEDVANFQNIVKDEQSLPGTAGQVLSSTGSAVRWVDNIETAQVTVTDAQIRTLGTVPVEILPGVVGYTYEILGATTQSIGSGAVGDSYEWGGQSGVISSRNNLFAGLHKVEIPNNQLPSGGGEISDFIYVGTPVAGISRTNSPIKVTVSDNIDPTIPTLETPSAIWKINITYRLIQVV